MKSVAKMPYYHLPKAEHLPPILPTSNKELLRAQNKLLAEDYSRRFCIPGHRVIGHGFMSMKRGERCPTSWRGCHYAYNGNWATEAWAQERVSNRALYLLNLAEKQVRIRFVNDDVVMLEPGETMLILGGLRWRVAGREVAQDVFLWHGIAIEDPFICIDDIQAKYVERDCSVNRVPNHLK